MKRGRSRGSRSRRSRISKLNSKNKRRNKGPRLDKCSKSKIGKRWRTQRWSSKSQRLLSQSKLLTQSL